MKLINDEILKDQIKDHVSDLILFLQRSGLNLLFLFTEHKKRFEAPFEPFDHPPCTLFFLFVQQMKLVKQIEQ